MENSWHKGRWNVLWLILIEPPWYLLLILWNTQGPLVLKEAQEAQAIVRYVLDAAALLSKDMVRLHCTTCTTRLPKTPVIVYHGLCTTSFLCTTDRVPRLFLCTTDRVPRIFCVPPIVYHAFSMYHRSCTTHFLCTTDCVPHFCAQKIVDFQV